jgi:hypothetical protein
MDASMYFFAVGFKFVSSVDSSRVPTNFAFLYFLIRATGLTNPILLYFIPIEF